MILPMEILISQDALGKLKELLFSVKELPGDIAELGCYRGGTSKVMSEVCTDKKVWAIDTFTGLPQPNKRLDGDKMWRGQFTAALPKVKYYLRHNKNIEIVRAFFPKNIPEDMYNKEYCFVHIDVDLYKATLAGLQFFWPRLVDGGIMVLDDIYSRKTPGVQLAFDNYFGKNKPVINCHLKPQGWIVK